MDINKIRDEARTEDSKMEMIADWLDGEHPDLTLDKVLENGDTATDKSAKFVSTNNADDFSIITSTQMATQKQYADGAAGAQITSDGKISLNYGPEQGNPTFLSIEVSEGTPKVLMSDDMKDAFKAALGIS